MSDNTQSNEIKNQLCAVCNIPANQKCSACKIVYYCNRDHQKSDWKIHSKKCRAFELVEDSIKGQHYIATRDIAIDEIVMYEDNPILILPPLVSGPICYNCYIPVTPYNGKPCNHCGWPLCRRCTGHGMECEVTMKYRKSKVKIPMNPFPNPLLNTVMILRTIGLKEKNPDGYRKFLNLGNRCIQMSKPTGNTLIRMVMNQVSDVVKKDFKINDVDVTEIDKIVTILEINGFSTNTPEGFPCNVIFDRASYISHDCHPSCRLTCICKANNQANITIRAITAIPKGHPITITYTNPRESTPGRLHLLRQSKYFSCTCDRCKDPTEFGTMFSAIKCNKKNCTGYMLPPTFFSTDGGQIPDYVCSECKAIRSSKAIYEMTEVIASKLSKVDADNVYELKKFIAEHSKSLHENHYLIVNAQLKLAISLWENTRNKKSLPDDVLKENMKLCRKINRLLQILSPVESVYRGTISYALYQYTTALAPRVKFRDPNEFISLLMEGKEAIAEAYRLLRYDPKNAEDSEMAESARLHLEYITKLLDA